ncbi:MAG: type II secretion system F family protein [Clostridia bacterium]|nr:type II secretion system F family protein [Clostridia bacterium]
MAVYRYRALTPNGVIVTNRIEENNRSAVIKKLKRNNLTPIHIAEQIAITKKPAKTNKRNVKDIEDIMKNANTTNLMANREKNRQSYIQKINQALSKTEKITNRDIVIFTQNFYLLKKANFNNIHALSTIIDSTENYMFKGILEDILAGVEAGENMYTTMEYYSNVFPYIYINMIKVGELSGSLTTSLEQAVKYLDDAADITKKVKKILIPNLAQFALLMVMLIVGTLFAIPSIQDVFEAVGTKDELPTITLWFQSFLNGVMAYWYIPTALLVGAIVGVVAYINTPKGKYNFDYFKYTMPIFGKLIFSLDFSRLMRAMLLNLNNGMRIQEALEVSKNVSKNYVMLSIIETSINNILIGQSWIEPFEKSGLPSSMITEMLKIGMKTDLAEMMEKLLEYMEIDINNILDKIMMVLPQVIYSIVGVVLIFFVLVVLVPCIQLYMGNFLFSAYGF